MPIYSHHWFPALLGVEAITLPCGVLIAGDFDVLVIAHEMAHVEQLARLGPIRFYIDYCCQFLRGLVMYRDIDRAYREISYEKEAYGPGLSQARR